ncbi:hypothetical protein Acsp04_47520 [Actinomadura sp. NBRC 104425]|uniref:Eco57I restriction-modification methylase domain-containing protein n=1 Tax=Actinomadura sp. NBRC 104425 TaxID=3032204 RepID=UPI0024A0752C|nr:DNA methyltransferase [Actinomadura sp. NBRC 104425]GLZ14517.1 hypothetical protein Acsp04_47520 [Actinomadura sp. NBRC 104425]
MSRRTIRRTPDSVQQHRDWLSLVEITGPFLSLPVLRETWPSLDPLDKSARERLRTQHGIWQDAPETGQRDWISYILGDLLSWGDALHFDGADAFAIEVAEHDTTITPSFALVEPGEKLKPETVRLLGMVCEPGQQPTARIKGDAWAATPADRMAHLCRYHNIELGLVTDGRWWALVWAPRGGVTTTAVFDAVDWAAAAERDVVRAFVSILCRRRFFGVRDEEKLVALLERSLDTQEEITEALGVQVRQAVELLVAAFGRADALGSADLKDVSAHEVYRGAVAVMMRIVFLLFAEERGLLPADNELYARAYSAGRLYADLEQRVREGSEEELEHTTAAWHRLLALFDAVYRGVDHPRLKMHAHDGSIFNPDAYPWLPLNIDDRTVLHMLKAVQYVQTGKGKNRELRQLSFKTLDVEQIGYVYEGLLSFEGFRAEDTVVGLIGKEGLEEEVHLTELEAHAAAVTDIPGLATRLATAYKDSKIGTAKGLEKRLAPLGDTDRPEAMRKLLAVTAGDRDLAERLLPFYGIIRTDLRGLPVVILPGALYVTESKLRKNTGTHYTPRFLAEEVVQHALEPLVYEPGPLQTADKNEWRLKSSKDILALKVADIAMGSGAFLVAACRYLADRLVQAWANEGLDRAPEVKEQLDSGLMTVDDDPLIIDARRAVIEHCLYGVDINPMAVEMAKLSLWLVSMDPERPFTFLDDRLVHGDSLLGITSLEQLEVMHMDPKQGRKLYEDAQRDLFDWTKDIRSVARSIAEDRLRLSEIDGSTIRGLAAKRAILAETEQKVENVWLAADLAVASVLAHSGKNLDSASLAAAKYAAEVFSGSPEAALTARDQRNVWLKTDLVDGAFPREPLHWPLVFPEVFDEKRPHGPGFDAIIGNPPFLGGKKISGSAGSAYRETLVEVPAKGAKGNADLVAYFVLRAHELLNSSGQVGVIATNTLTQGDTREVGLDRLLESGVTIRRSIKSEPWPSKGAVLEYCAIWTTCSPVNKNAVLVADGVPVAGITPTLDPLTRVTGKPYRLVASANIAFIGNNVNGIGFVLSDVEARELIDGNPVNKEVIFRYLNGEDLNSRPDQSASRWIIDFRDWSLERAEAYPESLERVRRLVKPRRDELPDSKRATREAWWRYEKLAPGLRAAISGLDRVAVIALVSKTAMPVMVPTGQVFSHALGVFATDDTAMLALLSSAPHYWWALTRASSMKADLRYTPSDVFETFPLPELTQEMRELGERLDSYRRDVMLARQTGLTKTYNLVFDEKCKDEDIVELRRIHKAIDEAVVRAYGWDDLLDQLDHGFHLVNRREPRYTIGPAAQREILDRLLELNHERYAEEVRLGLHDKKSKKGPRGRGGVKDNQGTFF